MLYFVLSAVLMNDFLIANSPSFREKEIKILFLSSTIGQGLFLAAGQVRQSWLHGKDDKVSTFTMLFGMHCKIPVMFIFTLSHDYAYKSS